MFVVYGCMGTSVVVNCEVGEKGYPSPQLPVFSPAEQLIIRKLDSLFCSLKYSPLSGYNLREEAKTLENVVIFL